MSKYVFGVDIGGTTVKIGLFTEQGEKVDVWEIPTVKENGGKRVLPDIASSIMEKLEMLDISKTDVLGIGMGAPGPVDDDGVIYKAVNIGWGIFNMKETMQGLTGLPCAAGNDANVAALGEMWKGSGQGCTNMVAVTLGTGVGGGIISNGTLITGALGSGGEFGHLHLQDGEDDACGCGNHGCFEQYASATGVVRIMNRILSESDKECVLRGKTFECKDVFNCAKAGDELCIEATHRFGYYLGKGLGMVASVINPEVFVIGGGVAKAGEIIIDLLKDSYMEHCFHAARGARFVLATLGNDAGMYGAAKLLIDRI